MIEIIPLRASAAILLVCLGIGIYKYLIHSAFLSSLSKIPNAHPLSAITPLWMLWIRYQDREIGTVDAAHEKYGPVVRLGPNEVSISCVDAGIRTVHGGGFEKPRYYSFFMNYGYGKH